MHGLWAHEFLNILLSYVNHGGMDRDQAVSLWNRANLRLAIGYRIAAYDAQDLALARQLDVCCVTSDRELIRKAPALAKSMEEFRAQD